MSRPLWEVGGGAGEMLRDLLHLRRVAEAEALISGASRDKDVDVYRTELEVTSHINRYLSDAAFRNIAAAARVSGGRLRARRYPRGHHPRAHGYDKNNPQIQFTPV